MEAGGNRMTYAKCLKEKNLNQEFYTWQNHPSKIKEKLKHYQVNIN